MKFNIPTARLFRWVAIVLVSLSLLSGCAQYDVGIRFTDANHGEITQHLRFDKELPGIGSTVVNSWLESFEQQAIQLGGRVQHLSSQELSIKIPFYNAKDLQNKFNRLFYAQARSNPNSSSIDSRLQIIAGNWIMWQHYHLQYDLDLRALEFAAANPANPAHSPESLQLELGLKTPWGAKPIDGNILTHPNPNPDAKEEKENVETIEYVSMPRQRGRQLIWQLKPGKINHVEATFWLPSPLGIGTVLIVLLVLGGSYAKARGLNLGDRSVVR